MAAIELHKQSFRILKYAIEQYECLVADDKEIIIRREFDEDLSIPEEELIDYISNSIKNN